MVADMTMKELNRDISGVIAMAKDYKDMDDEMIAKACDLSMSTIQHKKSKKELPLLSFWAVAAIAKCAGYRIVFEPERSSK